MAELQIYNSQGERVEADSRGYSERIENFFFGGVRFYVETKPHSETEFIVFFRARESEASRAEQYYAVYRTDDFRNIFERFRSDLKKRIEGEQGMLLQTSSDDVEVFNALTRDTTAPGTVAEHDSIESLLSEGKKLEFGVSSSSDAVGLLQKYLDGPGRAIAIADDIGIDELGDCTLLIELGSDEELEPLGDTEELLAEREQRKNSPSTYVQNVDEESSKKEEILNKGIQVAKVAGVSVVIFVVLITLLILVATLTNIEVISAFDVSNLI